jgi:hypothetical protein
MSGVHHLPPMYFPSLSVSPKRMQIWIGICRDDALGDKGVLRGGIVAM